MGRPVRYAERRVSTTLRLPADLLEALDETADEVVVSRNLLIERLLRAGLDRLNLSPPAAMEDQ